MIFRRALLAAVAAGLVTSPAAAELRALVIGVDKYTSKQELRGSVNDAADLAHVLSADGVSDVTTLTETQATKAAFDGAWSSITGRAQSGDVILLSFSGHGIRVPESQGHHERPDGYDKGFLLQPYDEAKAPDEILRDEDLYDLFATATAKGLKILFVADACHAGAAVRGVDTRATGGTFRFQHFETEAAPTAPAPTAEPVMARPANPDVTIFSATDERLSIQEVLLDGQFRGALSYAVARGLEGSAGEVDGWVSPLSLRRFVSPLVRELSSNRQIPQFAVPDGDLHVVSVSGKNGAHVGELGTLPLAVISPPSDLKLTGADVVTDRSTAELIWDGEREQVISPAGDVIATGVSAASLQSAVDARRVVDALDGMMARQPGTVTTGATAAGRAEGAYFVNGMTARFSIDPGDFNFVTMLDIAATGTIQFMWPLVDQGDPVEWTSTQPLEFTAPVSAPYGADFVVTLLSREPLTDLQAALKRIHNKAAPTEFFDALKLARATTEIRVGVLGVYSCRSLRSNGQCDSMLASSP